MSLIEVLVVLGVIAVVVGIGALSVESMDTPLRTAGEMLEGVLLQTRSRAAATTTAHRVRPSNTEELVVESAVSCDAGSWTAEPSMAVTLPSQVTLSETDWQVCFNRRGVASDNVVVTLNHPEQGSRQLEVLRGGTARWVH